MPVVLAEAEVPTQSANHQMKSALSPDNSPDSQDNVIGKATSNFTRDPLTDVPRMDPHSACHEASEVLP